MPEIFLPQKICFGDNSIEKFVQTDFDSVLIVSDSDEPNKSKFATKIKECFSDRIPKAELIIDSDSRSLYERAINYISENVTDRIVAIGSARLIDTAMLVSYQSGVGFAAVPFFSSCAMTDFDEIKYTSYCTSPIETVLDPELAMHIDSGTIAYDSMSCFAYALDTLLCQSSNVVCSVALSSAAEILNNAVGAYRGNFKSICKLQYAMYFAVLAHRSIADSDSTPLNGITEFFNLLGISKQTAAAICIPELAEYYRDSIPPELARRTGLFRSGEDGIYSVDRLIDRIRRIQAALNIPRSVSSICRNDEEFRAFVENSHLPSELLDLCYYGSFKFMKL